MPVIWGLLVSKFLPWLIHQIARFWGVFLVGMIALTIVMGYKNFTKGFYDRGYKAGYTQAMRDHPTYGNVGTINQNNYTPIVGVYRLQIIWKK